MTTPDQLVDAEKLKAIIADMDHCLKMKSTTDFSQGIDNATTTWRDALKALITPKLPTLADMTPEGREACRWMQAQTWHEVGIIVWVHETTGFAQLITRENGVLERRFEDVTPLSGEPKLEWPGSGGVEDAPTVDGEPTLPIPEDVPAGEPWIVKFDGHEWVGTRESRVKIVCSWALVRLDGADYTVARDDEITLVSRLVREPQA